MPFQIRTRADDADKHTADINSLVWHKGKLYSGADDGKIMAWEEDLKKVTEVQAHESSVFCLAASDDTVYSCSNDGSIKAWAVNDLSPKGQIFKDESEMYRLFSSDGHLFSSDEYGVVRRHEGKTVKALYNLLEQLKDLIVVDNLMYTVRDLDVIITELVGDKNCFQMKNSLAGKSPMAIAGNRLVFASRSGRNILVHDNSTLSNFKQIAEIKDAHEMIINALVAVKAGNETLIYSGGWDKIVKQWKSTEDGFEVTGSCNTDMVVNTMVYGEKGELYVGGSDGHLIRIDV